MRLTIQHILIAFLTLCFASKSKAQNAVISEDTTEINLCEIADFSFIDQDQEITDSLINAIDFQRFTKKVIPFHYEKRAYLFRFAIQNNVKNEDFVISCEQPNADHFEVVDSKLEEVGKTGDIYPWDTRHYKESYPSFNLKFTHAYKDTFYAKVYMSEDGVAPLMFYSKDKYKDFFTKREWLFGIFFGLMVVIGFFNIFLYIGSRDKLYLHYSFYVFAIATAQSALLGNSLGHFYGELTYLARIDYGLMPLLTGIVTIFFLTSYFKNAEKTQIFNLVQEMWKPFTCLVVVLIFFPKLLPEIIQILNVVFLISYVLIICLIVVYFSFSEMESIIFFCGWLTLLTGSSFFSLMNLDVISYSQTKTYLMPIGVALETIIISTAIGYRIRLLQEIRKHKNDQSRFLFTHQHNVAMSRKGIQLKALRDQLNPHFIFNALNSIQNFVLNESKEKANNLILNFSKLIRSNLDFTDATTISLEDEINFLSKYVYVEKVRFDDQFQVVFDIDPELDQNLFRLPPMLLQPIVENSIKHAFPFKKPENKLSITFRRNTIENGFTCVIEDNGVGISENKKSKHGYESKGSKITLNRIETLNSENLSAQIIFSYVNKADISENTGVMVNIEYRLNQSFN